MAYLPTAGWSYRFIDQTCEVPDELVGSDIGACCAAHLAKLANLLLECVRAFPFQVCPARALTEEGMATLGYNWRDVEVAVRLPTGYTDVAGIPRAEKVRILRAEIEPLDFESIERIASGDFRASGVPVRFSSSSGADLVDDIAKMMSSARAAGTHPRDSFVKAIMRRNKDVES